MTKREALQAIKKAKECYAAILLWADDWHYIKVSKKELIMAVNDAPENVNLDLSFGKDENLYVR